MPRKMAACVWLEFLEGGRGSGWWMVCVCVWGGGGGGGEVTAEAHNKKPWTPVLELDLTLPGMWTKQPCCSTTWSPITCFKNLSGCIRTDLIAYKEALFRILWKIYRMERPMDRTIYRMERPVERFSPTADVKAKGDFADSKMKPQQRLVA